MTLALAQVVLVGTTTAGAGERSAAPSWTEYAVTWTSTDGGTTWGTG